MLQAAGYEFEVVPPAETAEGVPCGGGSPAELVARLARQKAADVARRVSCGLVLACDTVAECEGMILGKPSDEDHARRILQILNGREHRVLSGLCLWPVPDGRPRVRVAVTVLRMERLSEKQLEEYLASRAWVGKAGAFGYQDRLEWIHILKGSETNVVGLPMELLAELLAEIGEAG